MVLFHLYIQSEQDQKSDPSLGGATTRQNAMGLPTQLVLSAPLPAVTVLIGTSHLRVFRQVSLKLVIVFKSSVGN